ncbi:MAG: 3-oxoacid CoA-transferase subunit B [Dehalococcoidia bacterium]|nr:3-oxoacid CoA-transferase subunit B [Dehalococcoidia bacterium]
MARRAAAEIEEGTAVNLGIGLPTLVSSQVPDGFNVWFQAENGVLGYGAIRDSGELDPDLINAGGQPIDLRPGGSFFDSVAAFAMIRGGHIDLAVLGGLQVSERGDLANWMIPERGGGSIGGAMDVAAGARRLVVVMEHVSKAGAPRIVRDLSYPLTARCCVDLIITDLAVIEVAADGLLLREVAPGVSPDDVRALTEPPLLSQGPVPKMSFEVQTR